MGLLAWFPAHKDCRMGSTFVWTLLVRLPRWSGLGIILCSWLGYELVSLPGDAAEQGPRHCFGDPNQAGLCTEYPGQTGPLVLLADRESPVLCSLFMGHCEQGCGVGYVASPVFWLGPLVRWAEGHIQQWMEL